MDLRAHRQRVRRARSISNLGRAHENPGDALHDHQICRAAPVYCGGIDREQSFPNRDDERFACSGGRIWAWLSRRPLVRPRPRVLSAPRRGRCRTEGRSIFPDESRRVLPGFRRRRFVASRENRGRRNRVHSRLTPSVMPSLDLIRASRASSCPFADCRSDIGPGCTCRAWSSPCTTS